MPDIQNFFNLSESLQLVIASGYIGYIISQFGYRKNERGDEFFYGMITFGLLGTMFFHIWASLFPGFPLPAFLSILCVIVLALLWRKWLRRCFFAVLHLAKITNDDGISTVWSRITQDTEMAPTQVMVEMSDGSAYFCENVSAFDDALIPRYYTDDDGNIAMYVTKYINTRGETEPCKNVRDEHWGDMVTYIPKDMIKSVNFRFIRS